jgi:hypothetical protein
MVEVLKGGRTNPTTTSTERSFKERYDNDGSFRSRNVANFTQWNEYNPWDLTGRLDANMNMYDGPGGCSVFRTFQGWLGLSRHGPQQGTYTRFNR